LPVKARGVIMLVFRAAFFAFHGAHRPLSFGIGITNFSAPS
jgi:hypothetical protein